MFLHKYKDDSGTFYGLTSSNNANNVKLLADSVGSNTIPADRVKNFLQNIETAFREKPEKVPEEKPKEPKKKPEEKPEKKKASVSDMIRKYAQMLSSYSKE